MIVIRGNNENVMTAKTLRSLNKSYFINGIPLGLLAFFYQIPTHNKTIDPKNTPTYIYSKLRRFTTTHSNC